jgi:hypothetical protein
MQNSAYEMEMKFYMQYWEDVLLHLSKLLLLQSITLFGGLLAFKQLEV